MNPSGASSLLQHLGWTVPDGERARNPLEDWWTSDEALTAAAMTLRRFHDAQAAYEPPPTATWCAWFADWPARKRPVICHNEFGPTHAVRQPDGTLAMIGFELAAPGPRLLDVAYSAWAWLPESDRPRRLRLFSDVYGLSATQRTRLVRAIRQRVVIEIGRRDGTHPWVRSLRTLDLEHHRLEAALL
jgi:aminoglycoside phosphotransferase (APT) family kinase protein